MHIFKLAIAMVILPVGIDSYANGRGATNCYGDYGSSYLSKYNRHLREQSLVNEVIVKGHNYSNNNPVIFPRNPLIDPMVTPPYRKERGSSGSAKNKDTKQQCIDTCLESFGNYYKVAVTISPLSLVGGASTVLQTVGADTLEHWAWKRGIKHIHDPDRRLYSRGANYLSGAKIIRSFSGLTLYAGVLGLIAEISISTYCKDFKCNEKASNRTSKSVSSKRKSYNSSYRRYR